MIIGDFFEGDKDEDLKNIQHDLWFGLDIFRIYPDQDIDENLYKYSNGLPACFYLFSEARKVYFRSGHSRDLLDGVQPLFFPEGAEALTIQGVDHRSLSWSYQIIADYYRWMDCGKKKPSFYFKNAYKIYHKSSYKKTICNDEGCLTYLNWIKNSWVIYFKTEIHQIFSLDVNFTESVLKAAYFNGKEKGFEAEARMHSILKKRYKAMGFDEDRNRLIRESSVSKENSGYIYIAISPALPKNWLKIGRTARDPEKRMDELSNATGVPLKFYVAFDLLVIDCVVAEKIIHEALLDFRVASNREFFEVSLKEAIKIVINIAEKFPTCQLN